MYEDVFVKIVDGFLALTVSQKSSLLAVWHVPKYASEKRQRK